jgi:5-aminopentanamidase
MRIAVFQGPAQSQEVAGNLAVLAAQAGAAAREGARLLVCPEMFLTGYAIGREAAERLAEPADGPSAAAAARIATANRIALAYGYPEHDPGGRGVFNAALLIASDGRPLLNYRKSHLFGGLDRAMFRAGEDPLEPVELGGFRVGMLICYDVEFPENVRRWALAGADLVLVPTALMEPYDFVARSLVAARAYENQLFVAYANRCDREGDLVYIGRSCIVAPTGHDLGRAGSGEELIVADLDRVATAHSRKINTYLADRRPDQYGALCRAR